MINKDFGILLKENKGDQLGLEIDPDHPEKYAMPENLWKLSIQGINYYPPVKGKENIEEAYKWLKKGAELGNPRCQWLWGNTYHFGEVSLSLFCWIVIIRKSNFV